MFFKWQLFAILDLMDAHLDHPRLGSLYRCAKFGCNQRFVDFNILHDKLENAYSPAPKWEFWGLDPLNGKEQQWDPQKAHPCVKTCHITYRLSKSVYRWKLSAFPRKSKNGSPKIPNVTRHMSAETTHIVTDTHGHHIVIHSKFHQNLFRGFGATWCQNVPFPPLLLLAFTTACTTVQAVIYKSNAFPAFCNGLWWDQNPASI